MSNDELEVFEHNLKLLMESPQLAMISDQLVEEFMGLCTNARLAAEKGDLKEAVRLFQLARDFLQQESERFGIVGN